MATLSVGPQHISAVCEFYFVGRFFFIHQMLHLFIVVTCGVRMAGVLA